jgi:penicillin-binding protein 1A
VDALSGAKGAPVVALSAAPPVLTRAFVVADDPTYLEHQGLHTGSVLRMFATKLYDPAASLHGGASLTQQLARVLLADHDQHPWPRFSGALREVMLTVQLDNGLSKDQILAAYLNSIPFAPGVRGVVDASTHYFHKPLTALTVTDVTRLAALPHHPPDLSPASPKVADERRRRILDALLAAGAITSAQHAVAEREGGNGSLADGSAPAR